MSIPQQVLLRYRSAGHLRFELPAVLCGSEYADHILSELQSMEGVYRVDLNRRQGKLSIRYMDTVCDFAEVIRCLYDLITRLSVGIVTPSPQRKQPVSLSASAGPVRWLRSKAVEATETFTAMNILIRQGVRKQKGLMKRPNWVSEFLNDLLMLYLIKIHWHSITHLWMVNPWRYRYEWAATFYLIYLQVKSRLPQQLSAGNSGVASA
jgi:hypothetical protein